MSGRHGERAALRVVGGVRRGWIVVRVLRRRVAVGRRMLLRRVLILILRSAGVVGGGVVGLRRGRRGPVVRALVSGHRARCPCSSAVRVCGAIWPRHRYAFYTSAPRTPRTWTVAVAHPRARRRAARHCNGLGAGPWQQQGLLVAKSLVASPASSPEHSTRPRAAKLPSLRYPRGSRAPREVVCVMREAKRRSAGASALRN